MSPLALALAALRTVPLALCLPLPGLLPRLAFGLVLATFGATLPQDPSWLRSMLSGIGLGLLVLAPVWAARWAGAIVGWTARARALEGVYTTLAWLAFFAAGGPLLLLRASVGSASLAGGGTRFVGLAASIALPTLLALAVVEVLAAVAERFERAAEAPLHTKRMAHAARPLFASLLLLAGLASIIQGVGHATRETPAAVAPAR